jgi:hypothetical protein
MIRPALGVLLLATAALADEPRLMTTELGIATNFVQFQTRSVTETWNPRVIALRLVARGFVIDFRTAFTTVFPLGPSPLRGSAELRLGYSGRRWAVVAGAYLLDGFNTTPRFQALPTARAELKISELTLVAGLWDYHLPDVPFHLSVASRDVGLGYVYPFGVEAHFRLRVVDFIGLVFQALVLQRNQGEVVAFGGLNITVGVLSGKPPKPRSTMIPGFLDPTR